ncbi:cytochrome c oxidase subunit II [Mesorhizobium sp. RMAD-H1]|uniref:cytochrome c oxidase subunit II n=1 Tax=Mesorhizobium sp. RMAD-H1 TaxID=2587065 RepID=UPI00161B07CE|nr:cytochrome c oxidase subunit II [Mesorhizobium sp. RMAD-H1]MBB2971392.1 cytochrome c oxidase subunit 2 [Mesorhizobium sp. RMAD-H1]
MRLGFLQWPAAGALLLLASGCAGVQSALDPAGAEAGRIHTLSWVLILFCTAVFIITAVIAAAALFGSERWRRRLSGEKLIIGAGLIFPAVTLTLLLAYGIIVLGMGGSPADTQDGLRISVVGERWWWRVIYHDENGRRIESANELRIPAGRPVRIDLTSADVIHSFWVPKLAGKLDMIPGRVNTLTLDVEKPGVSRGQCAEYCGGAHALMSFFVIAMAEGDFAAWLANEAKQAGEPTGNSERRGRELFMASGCGACHTVRGTAASGTIGPDLTHVGSRHSLAAATLPNDAEAFARWIRDGQHIKPENLMPAYRIFTDEELASLSSYLAQLR